MKKTTIITHSGNFHTDDIFAVATLKLLMPDAEVVRSREKDIVKTGDFLVDVGEEYDEEKNHFDHHQKGFAGERTNGVLYASFGLVWKKYGEKVCGSKLVADRIERRLVTPIDAYDNGINLFTSTIEGLVPYTIEQYVTSFYPTWKEKEVNNDAVFMELEKFAEELLKREIKKTQSIIDAMNVIEEVYNESVDKRVIVLEDRFPLEAIDVLTKYPEPMFVVKPSEQGESWKANTIRYNIRFFGSRKDFPKSWAGKRDHELAEISGVPDASFCHNKMFLVVAKSKEGAIALAKKAVED